MDILRGARAGLNARSRLYRTHVQYPNIQTRQSNTNDKRVFVYDAREKIPMTPVFFIDEFASSDNRFRIIDTKTNSIVHMCKTLQHALSYAHENLPKLK